MKCEQCGSAMVWRGSMRDGRMECAACAVIDMDFVGTFDEAEQLMTKPMVDAADAYADMIKQMTQAVPKPRLQFIEKNRANGLMELICIDCSFPFIVAEQFASLTLKCGNCSREGLVDLKPPPQIGFPPGMFKVIKMGQDGHTAIECQNCRFVMTAHCSDTHACCANCGSIGQIN